MRRAIGVVTFALAVCFCLGAFGGYGSQKVAVLVCDSPWIERPVDERVQKRLEDEGFVVESVHYPAVTDELLRQFNVVVMNWDVNLSPTGETPEQKRQKWDVLQRFVELGGGLLVFGYHAGNPDLVPTSVTVGVPPLNEFLRRFGARYLPQAIWEEDEGKRALPKGSEAVLAIDHGRQFAFAVTENITPHPVTEGVRQVWFPIGWMYDMATLPIEVDDNWTILVRASATAKSLVGFPNDPEAQKVPTISSAPPFVACREWGKGRIVVFASHPTFWMQAAYHRLWGNGFVYERGDGWRLMVNILRWLAEPSLRSGQPGGYEPKPKPKPAASAPPKWAMPEWQKRAFKGLIGAHTSLSDGMGSVADFCAAAKAAGYHFIVFTEDLQQLDPEEWEVLVKECQKQSDEGFVAIPGIKFLDEAGARYIAFALPFYPERRWLGEWENRRRRYIADMPGFYFGEAWAPLAILAPKLNPHPISRPWFQKFYGAFAVFTYDRDRLVDESLDWYLERMGNQYNSVPVAVHEVFSPNDVFSATKGVQSYAWATDLLSVADNFKHHWYANPQRAFISSGPMLLEWWIEHPSDEFSKRFALHIAVQSEVPIREICLYDGHRLWRRFVVRSKEFRGTVTGWHDQQRFFVLVARDEKGGILVSPTLWTTNTQHRLVMCTDMQNTLEGVELWHPEKGRRVSVLTAFNTVTGWGGDNGVPVPLPWEELSPPGFDWNMAGARFAFNPQVRTTWGNEEGVAKVNIHFANPHLAVEDLEFTHKLLWGSWATPLTLVEPFARRYHFPPRLYGYDAVLGEVKIRCKQDFTFAEADGPNLRWLGLSLVSGFHRWAVLDAKGEEVTGGALKREGVTVPEGVIPRNGCIVFMPGTAGGIAVFPLSSDIVFRIEGNGVALGEKRKGKAQSGQTFTNSLLLVRLPIEGEPIAAAREFGEAIGLFANGAKRKWQARALHGKIVADSYPLRLQSEGGGVLLEFEDKGLVAGLPAFVEGLNDRWDAFVWREGSREFSPLGVREGVGYFQFSEAGKDSGTFYLGHIAVCDDRRVCLSVGELSEESLLLEAHNPTDQRIVAVVRRAKGLRRLPYFERKIALNPGETVRLKIDLRR